MAQIIVEGLSLHVGPAFTRRVPNLAVAMPFEPLTGSSLAFMKTVVTRAVMAIRSNCSGLFAKIGDKRPLQAMLDRTGVVATSREEGLAGYVSDARDICITTHCQALGLDFTVRAFLHELAHAAGVGPDYGGTGVSPARSHIRAHQVEYACTNTPFDANDGAVDAMLRSMKAQQITVEEMLRWGTDCGSCGRTRRRRR